jgi:hypothetical protein
MRIKEVDVAESTRKHWVRLAIVMVSLPLMMALAVGLLYVMGGGRLAGRVLTNAVFFAWAIGFFFVCAGIARHGWRALVEKPGLARERGQGRSPGSRP